MSLVSRRVGYANTIKRAHTAAKVLPPVPVRKASSHPSTAASEKSSLRKARAAKTKPQSSVDVVNERLCDDALTLLAPSLESLKGCNVIDIFPRSAVWSRKVHELLQPRSHILVAKPKDGHADSIQALLKEPGSRYIYWPRNKKNASASTLYEDVLVDLDQLTHLTAKDVEPNKNILVLATLTDLPKVRSNARRKVRSIDDLILSNTSPSISFVSEFLRQNKGHIGSSKLNLSRLLLWTLDRDKFTYLPRTVNGRNNGALEVEESCVLHEIVGASEPPKTKRPARLEVQSAVLTAQRMKDSDLVSPANRQPSIHQSVSKQAIRDDVVKAVRELDDLEIKLALGDFEQFLSSVEGSDKRRKEHTEEYKKLMELRSFFRSLAGEVYESEQNKISTSMQKAITCQVLLNALLRKDVSLETTYLPLIQRVCGTSDLKSAMQLLNSQIAALINQLPEGLLTTTGRILDEHDALQSEPALLAWDRRTFEPLESLAEDFSPKHRLALLDFQPREIKPELVVSQNPFIRAMRGVVQRPVPEALDRIANGASQALLPHCPTICNPVQGGRSDPMNLRVRMLTHEMWRELNRAWNQWPFRKSDVQIATELGITAPDLELEEILKRTDFDRDEGWQWNGANRKN